MRSTYDRRGGNERADAAHYLYQLSDDKNVSLDVQGPGILYFVRYNHWHGSPWHYEVDGKTNMVAETTTADPLHPAENSVFQPTVAFPKPLTFTWADTKGADLSWVPIAFEKSFRMAYTRTFYGTGYYIYHQFVEGTKLSQPIRSWNLNNRPADDVLKLINRSGTDLVNDKSIKGLKEASGKLDLRNTRPVAIWAKAKGAGVVRAFDLSIPEDHAQAFSNARLRITWDDRTQPSVDAPIPLFFGAGTLYNRDHREYLVKSFPMTIRYSDGRIHLSCYMPMPFFKSARIELVGTDVEISDVRWRIRYAPLRDRPNDVGYFHATYRDYPTPEPGKDVILLDTKEVEGSVDWSGQLVGTSFIFSHSADLRTLEGDPRFFFDDSLTPQAQGTGTEEWGGGGDYWGGVNMTLPFAGHPVGARSAETAVSDEDRIESAYRFLLADLMPFGKNAVIQLEHGGVNESTQHYETVAYWYGLPAASLLKTDELSVGDKESEQQHQYSSPDASASYEIRSRYEWGPDTLNGKEIYPETVDHGRTTQTGSEFTLRIDPTNVGVMLRRKLDYSFPNQRAEVYISGESLSDFWQLAGIWYSAGSNTCVFSNPPAKDELGTTQHIVETSNRRFRDDEFLIPRMLTKGRSSVRIRVKFTPVSTPLFPGYATQELAWSEIRYSAYSFVHPDFRLAKQ